MITAIVLAAGESRRMGRPKMLMSWGETSVLGHVLDVLRGAGVEELLVVTGGSRLEVEGIAESGQARVVFNADHARGEMLSSLQCGLNALEPATSAALICLGDQPQLEAGTVRQILEEYARTGQPLIVPSHLRRRGHPWLVGRQYWDEILHMHAPESPREFLNRRPHAIQYVEVETPSILQDLDTPGDYSTLRPPPEKT